MRAQAGLRAAALTGPGVLRVVEQSDSAAGPTGAGDPRPAPTAAVCASVVGCPGGPPGPGAYLSHHDDATVPFKDACNSTALTPVSSVTCAETVMTSPGEALARSAQSVRNPEAERARHSLVVITPPPRDWPSTAVVGTGGQDPPPTSGSTAARLDHC